MSTVDLVKAAFNAKRVYGSNSEEFKTAQEAAFLEIGRTCKAPHEEVIKTDAFGAGIGLRVVKSNHGPSYSLVKERLEKNKAV